VTAVVEDAEALPAEPGAYLLVIDLLRPLARALPGRANGLPAGRYAYAGSARGPGGIRARVRRHLKAAKTVRWHVDRLTNSAGVQAVLAFPGWRECDLVVVLAAVPGVTAPVSGFGSTDCRCCAAHLLALPDDLDAGGLAALLGPAAIWRAPPAACFWRPGSGHHAP
jgi:histidyl-tRNA synthetase